jgi:hypothetical protein
MGTHLRVTTCHYQIFFIDCEFPLKSSELPENPASTPRVDLFFQHDPCGPRIIHRTTFLQSMALGPSHRGYPHPALLHTICASASRWLAEDGPSLRDEKGQDRFAEFQANKARMYIDEAISDGTNVFPLLAPCIILAYWLYAEGKAAEAWSHANLTIRASVPLGCVKSFVSFIVIFGLAQSNPLVLYIQFELPAPLAISTSSPKRRRIGTKETDLVA